VLFFERYTLQFCNKHFRRTHDFYASPKLLRCVVMSVLGTMDGWKLQGHQDAFANPGLLSTHQRSLQALKHARMMSFSFHPHSTQDVVLRHPRALLTVKVGK
jgi:hypothetical protein